MHPAVYGFAGNLTTFDVVPPSWITADGKADASQSDESDSATAYVFPSRLASDPRESKFTKHIPVVLGKNGFQKGVYRFQDIEIATHRFDADLVVEIEGTSLEKIHLLDWQAFRDLQAGYLSWLAWQSVCWPSQCFTGNFEPNLRKFWKDDVLGANAQFAAFASSHFDHESPDIVANRLAEIPYDTGAGVFSMWATRVYPGQELSVTWGNQNLDVNYPPTGGSTVGLINSYSRTTSGGNVRLRIVRDGQGVRLFPREGDDTRKFPATGCGAREVPEGSTSDQTAKVIMPYPGKLANQLGVSLLPIYNMFDLHNRRLLAAPTDLTNPACPGDAPPFLILLTPSQYTKADVNGGIVQFETEAQVTGDGTEEYKSLFRQFVILGCKSDKLQDVRDEWTRVMDIAAKGTSNSGKCGVFVHGVFLGKTFVERMTHVTFDGVPVEGGVASFTTIAQAVAFPLGVRMNMRSPPGGAPLLELWRTPIDQPDGADPKRLRLRFHTTMSGVLEKAIVLEGDDIHVRSISEVLR